MEYISVAVGVVVGVLSCAAMTATLGRWVLKAVVKEVITEVSGQWVPAPVGHAHAERLARLEKQFDTVVLPLVAHNIGKGE